MRFSTTQHQCYGGLDLHARRMYVGGLHQDGELVGHRQMNTSPAPWLKVLAPYRAALVIAGECGFTWSWLAALGAQAGLPGVRGPARYMQALPGGKAQNDRMAAHPMAGLLRGGRLPQASADPAVLCWRDQPAAQPSLARRATPHRTGQAWPRRAYPLARAVDALRKREPACDRPKVRQGSGRGAGAPRASLDAAGISLETALGKDGAAASLPAHERRGFAPCAHARGGRPLPRTWPSRANEARSATSLKRTARGPSDGARPQRTRRRGLCSRHLAGARAAIRVWGRPTSAAPAWAITAAHEPGG
jgi:hypothetical protein